MATKRYNFAIHGKVKVGRLINYPFVTAFFDDASDDAKAKAFATWLESILANYAKCGITKVIKEGLEGEIPDPNTLTDTHDVQLFMSNVSDPNKRYLVTIPGVAPTAAYDEIKTKDLLYPDGSALDNVAKTAILAKNVIAD